jgi:hypothetical protein
MCVWVGCNMKRNRNRLVHLNRNRNIKWNNMVLKDDFLYSF